MALVVGTVIIGFNIGSPELETIDVESLPAVIIPTIDINDLLIQIEDLQKKYPDLIEIRNGIEDEDILLEGENEIDNVNAIQNAESNNKYTLIQIKKIHFYQITYWIFMIIYHNTVYLATKIPGIY